MADIVIVGLERALLGFTDSTGGSTGQQTTLSNGSTSGAYVASYVRTANYSAAAAVNVDFQGGDVVFGTAQFGNAKTNPFDIIATDWDETLVTLISGSTQNTANNTSHPLTSDNPARPSPRIMWVALQSRAEAVDGTASYYVTQVFPRCQVRIKRNGPGYQAVSDTVINVTPLFATKTVQAQGFGSSALAMTLTGDKTDNYFIRSTTYPIHHVAFRQNASATTFSTVYKPISTTVTVNATPNEFVIGGVATALSSITLAGVATLSAAGSAAVLDGLWHQTEFVPI